MLKRTLNTILLALTLAFSVNAGNVSGYPIGYCNGEAGTSSKFKFDGEDKEVSAAIYIPSTYAATVAGNSVDAIRVALCSKLNVEELRVWVRESLDGADLSSGSMPIADYAQGWNDVALDSPYSISEGCGGFYLGMTYRQSRKSGPVSILETPHDNALLADNVRITVMLVEDNIESRKQAGAGTGYLHQHVGRAVNSTWGEQVEWSGDDYEYSCVFSLDSEWNLDNLKVVAFISDYDASDPCACEVKNASSCDVVPVSVSELDVDGGKTLVGVMTADGIRVSAPVNGLNILLYSDGSYRKVMVR